MTTIADFIGRHPLLISSPPPGTDASGRGFLRSRTRS
jgi:hypothetical protein